MFHLAAYYESIDPGGALVPIAAVQDQAVTTSGDDIRVPAELPYLVGQIALGNDSTLAQAQLLAPSLRAMTNLDMEPIIAAAVFGNPPEAMMHPLNPIPLRPDESLNLEINSNPAAAADHYGLVWLGNGQLNPITGNIYSVRATSSITLSAGSWVNGNLTFGQTLPVGRYQVLGMRARGTNLVASRLVFPGGVWRPGVPAVNALGDRDAQVFRYGRMGVFGEFHSTTPPTVDCLGITDTSQVYTLDLMRVGG